jgi:serine/threonine-protein kinase HipA
MKPSGLSKSTYLCKNSFCWNFRRNGNYLLQPDAKPVSLTLPLDKNSFQSKVLFPFFDGLIPEGWLLEVAIKTWKINRNDRMGLLFATCKDNIGYVEVVKWNTV